MLVVTVDLWPNGDQARRVRLGTVQITNDVTGTPERGSYVIRARGKRDRPLNRFATITGWPRRSRPVLSLVKEALKALGF